MELGIPSGHSVWALPRKRCNRKQTTVPLQNYSGKRRAIGKSQFVSPF